MQNNKKRKKTCKKPIPKESKRKRCYSGCASKSCNIGDFGGNASDIFDILIKGVSPVESLLLKSKIGL